MSFLTPKYAKDSLNLFLGNYIYMRTNTGEKSTKCMKDVYIIKTKGDDRPTRGTEVFILKYINMNIKIL